jgi:hypothetical protein
LLPEEPEQQEEQEEQEDKKEEQGKSPITEHQDQLY